MRWIGGLLAGLWQVTRSGAIMISGGWAARSGAGALYDAGAGAPLRARFLRRRVLPCVRKVGAVFRVAVRSRRIPDRSDQKNQCRVARDS